MVTTTLSALLIIAPKDFRDEEYFEPYAILKAGDIRVVTASTLPEATSKQGVIVKVDQMLGELTSVDHDAIVFIGGSGASIYLSMMKAHKLAQDYLAAGKIVGAICMAPSILANAGLLEGVKVSSYSGEHKNLAQRGALIQTDPVTIDGQIITADGPSSATAFAEKLADRLLNAS